MMDIDFVIPWVDGSDPAWLAEKNECLPDCAGDSASANRYRDWDLLRYWFRSVEKYAPWVRKIHFLTWGHVPEFLDRDCPKLHIVRHTDFIPAEYLPTFSSHVIEMNLHRIPDLAEHFVYFNDDTFLLRDFRQEDFFRDGLPCTYGAEIPWTFCGRLGIWAHAAANDLGVINAHFSKRAAVRDHGRKYLAGCYGWKTNLRTFGLQKLFPDQFTGFKNLHAPAAYLKQTIREVWEAEPELLGATCRNRFRTAADVNQWVFIWWQIAKGSFSPAVIDNFICPIHSDTIERACDAIVHQRYAYLCANDPEELEEFEALARRLQDAFQTMLPEKSSFEK